ncbi:MAG TPA: RnfH family protein [Burkholderiales bacterium]|nr:RnfH family protein [Burkholderiales bacterium]
MIKVEVVYAEPLRQLLYSVEVLEGSTIAEAIQVSGLVRDFPALDLTQCRVGIHARLANVGAVVEDGDRVEIYRPLSADPKEARRGRIKKT